MNLNEHPAIVAALTAPKQKFTLLGMGVMGAFRQLAVTRGPIPQPNGVRFGFSEPRKQKTLAFDAPLGRGAILLRGHLERDQYPMVEGDVAEPRGADGFAVRSFVLGGGPRLVAPQGKEALFATLREHFVLHTLCLCQSPILLVSHGEEKELIGSELLAALPLGLEGIDPPEKRRPARKPVLRDSDTARLREAKHANMKPLVKLFDPAGASTWLLTSLDADGDTLWGYADLGQGCVEHGSISLRELEEIERPFGLRIERDHHFERCDYAPAELLAMTSIPTGLTRRTQPA